jgi:hypothetical protein
LFDNFCLKRTVFQYAASFEIEDIKGVELCKSWCSKLKVLLIKIFLYILTIINIRSILTLIKYKDFMDLKKAHSQRISKKIS